MSIINPLAREISAKVVYYGPGLSGKTTTLKHIHSTVKPSRRGELVTLATEGDRTIFFDFLPLHVEKVRDMGVRLQLYTVPGQVFYAATRKLVLNGADGVVFVADSQRQCRDANLESFDSLQSNLSDMGLSLETVPFVIQYNKRDLPDIMSIKELSAELNPFKAPEFATAATDGTGVLAALKEVIRLVLRSLWKHEAPVSGRMATRSEPMSKAPSEDSIASRLSDVVEQIRKDEERQEQEQMAAAGDGVSFASLWTGSSARDVRRIEQHIRSGDFAAAVQQSAASLAELLESLPGPESSDGPKAHAALLGLDGREYLKLCHLAGAPSEALVRDNALFALYLLIAAQFKAKSI